MFTVTQLANKTKQPYGGYIRVRDLIKDIKEDYIVLYEDENVSPIVMGIAVDYLVRFLLTGDKEKTFYPARMGASNVGETKMFNKLLKSVKKLDSKTIITVIKLSGFDVAFRAGPGFYVPVKTIKPNKDAVNNLRVMVERVLSVVEDHPPLISTDVVFPTPISNNIITGDIDLITGDTLWDIKTSIKPPTSKHTLQLALYYFIGKKLSLEEFDNVRYIGIINPRLNIVYRYDMFKIKEEYEKTIKENLIG